MDSTATSCLKSLVVLTRQNLSQSALVRVCVVLKVLVLNNTVMNRHCKFPDFLGPPRDQRDLMTTSFNILVISSGFHWELSRYFEHFQCSRLPWLSVRVKIAIILSNNENLKNNWLMWVSPSTCTLLWLCVSEFCSLVWVGIQITFALTICLEGQQSVAFQIPSVAMSV